MSLLYVSLSRSLTEQINSGLIKPGEKLPSIRGLMKQYGVSKNTAINALSDLEAKGLIEARNKVGFFVSNSAAFQQRTPRQHFPQLVSESITLSDVFHQVMLKGAAFDVLPSSGDESPSNALLSLNKHIRRAFRQDVQYRSSHYDIPQGDAELRYQISSRYRQRNINITDTELCITSGCQHGLMLALMATCEAGDTVVVESPTFYGSLALLAQLKLNVIEISSSPVTGLDITQFEQALSKWPVKACIVTPNFATPTGSLMPEENRGHFMDLANQYDLAVIEDDIYGELSFTQPVSALKTYDQQQRVILVSSFSKSLSRDLRIGWVAGGRWQQKIEQLKLTSQLASSPSVQQGLAEFIKTGEYRRHINCFSQQLEQRKHQLLNLLHQYWPNSTRFTNPSGGLAIWVELDKRQDSQKLFQSLYQQGIVITPGMLFSFNNQYKHCLRISFQQNFNDMRTDAIRRIGEKLQ